MIVVPPVEPPGHALFCGGGSRPGLNNLSQQKRMDADARRDTAVSKALKKNSDTSTMATPNAK